jgi:DNA-binding NarL/FixJ family response regulator
MDLQTKIVDDKGRLEEIMRDGAPEQNKSVIRNSRAGMRITSSEILDALIQNLAATIIANEHEVDTITRALKTIESDVYYLVIKEKFVDGKGDEEIAKMVPCNPATVRRNRGRLIRRLSVYLYGVYAL